MLKITEIFKSIQGESTHAGKPCAFVRLAGCNLACTYCDSAYARAGGEMMALDEICGRVAAMGCGLAEITGGEPLIQEETPALCEKLLGMRRTVLVETNGSCDISVLPPGCVRIVDIKCPGSGMGGHFLDENIGRLGPVDECKFVLSDRRDFEWALGFAGRHRLDTICTVIFSPAFLALAPEELAAWILDSNAPVRLGLQIHKYLWKNRERGV
jgi:7-carboxy-7-deazaguanine synthase